MSTFPFENLADTPIAPALRCFPINPDNSTELETVTKAIYVGSGGDITLRSAEGDTDVTFRNVPGGYILDVRVRAIRSSGTTATDLVGLA